MILKRLQMIGVGAGGVLAALTSCGQTTFVMDFSSRAQTIENIGSSTGMHGDYIARHWKPEVVDAVAELLFSREFDERGSPVGIGLSSFRIQIGAGAEGAAGGIKAPWRRTECFLRSDGSYDWGADRGVAYWRGKLREYSVPTAIGYLNSPPVHFTKNGYAFKTDKRFSSNLKPEHYGDYAAFVAQVAARFEWLRIPFDYISPVNEPQWGWYGVPGKAKQEGTPWTNGQIARLVRLMDAEFRKRRVTTRLLIPEAGKYDALYAPLPGQPFAAATDQARAFWRRGGPAFVGDLPSVEKVAAGHAYFSDGNIETLTHTRRAVKKAVRGADADLRFWQTEYSLLGGGWTGGLPKGEVDEMTAALLLARAMHVDFTLADAAAWQWWSSTEPRVGRVPRYCLIECDARGAETFRATKLLWALGHYSRFVRPGMERIAVKSSVPLERALASVMASAYVDAARRRWVMVFINLTEDEQAVSYEPRGLDGVGRRWNTVGYQTDRGASMRRFVPSGAVVSLPPKSIVTLVSEGE